MQMPSLLELQEAAIALAPSDLAITSVLLQKSYVPEWFHSEICRTLEAVARGELKRVIITMPPQHGKSELSSIKFPLFVLGNYPDKRVIEVCYSGDVAARFGREVRNSFSNPIYKRIFPNVSLREDSQAANRFNTDQGGYYLASGRGGAITSYGCDVLIIDDMFKNKEEADSETIRQKVWDEYVSTLNTRLNKDSAIIMLATRWHDSDLIGRVLAHGPDKWKVISYPAIAKETDEHREKGEALWPKFYPLEYLAGIKALDPDAFECMYQCDPVNEASAEFQRSWFKYYQDHECPSNMRIYITVDLAISEKESADEVSIMVTGITSDLSVYVLDYRHGRRMDGFDPSETIEQIFELADIYGPVAVGIESNQYQAALKHFMEKEMRHRSKPINIVEVRTTKDKEIKIRGLIAYYKSGRLYHRAGGFCSALEQQLLRFPKSSKDDVMDSLAMAMEFWEAPNYGKPGKAKPLTRRQALKEEGLSIPMMR